MAVSKTFPASAIREAYNAGQRLFGENRVQEFAAKFDEVKGLAGAEFHLIGHLQTNKAAKAVEIFGAVDSVDSLRLAEKLSAAVLSHPVAANPAATRVGHPTDSAAATRVGHPLRILVEVNVGGEEQKTGVAAGEALELIEQVSRMEGLEVRGLMTVPPFSDDPESARPYFRRLRELRDQAGRQFPALRLETLSMGMSHDFEVAIEEGSTCVRVGTAIFGVRPHA